MLYSRRVIFVWAILHVIHLKYVRLEKVANESDAGAVRRLEDFKPHRWLAARLDASFASKLKRGWYFGLAHAKREPEALLREMDDSRYLFLQLLHALESGDMDFANAIMDFFPWPQQKTPQTFYSWIMKSFRFNGEKMNKLIDTYSRWFSRHSHPSVVPDVMLLLAKAYSTFDEVAPNTDLLRWLLGSRLRIYNLDSNVIEHLWNHGGRQYVNIIFKNHSENMTLISSQDDSFLEFTIKNGRTKTVVYLLEKNITTLYDVLRLYIKQNATIPTLIIHNLKNYSIGTFFEDIMADNRVDLVEKIVESGFPLNNITYKNLTLLYWAAERDIHNLTKFLVQVGSDANFTLDCQTSLLHVAVVRNNTSALKRLLDVGAFKYAKDCQDRTPMHIAIQSNKTEMIRELGESGFDVNYEDDNGNRLIYFAIANGTSQALDTLINLGCKVNVVNATGITPLLQALLLRKSGAVSVLIDHGANYNYTASKGNTLVHICAMKGSVSCLNALRGLRMPIDKNNTLKETPLFKAVQANRPESVQLLIQSGADYKRKAKNGDTLLHVAVVSGSVAALRTLLKMGMEADCEGHGLATPMERAISKDDTACMRVLRQFGADIHRALSYSYNSSLLHYAVRYGRNKATNWLIENGIPPDVKDFNGWTPLHWAVMKRQITTARILILHKANVNALNVDGQSPLYITARNGYPEILQELVNHGANANISNKIGFAPLHIAALNGHHSVVHELLNNDIDVNIRTNSGNTALHLASWKGHLSIVQELLRYPANVTCTTNTGYTALHVAIIFGRDVIAQELMNHNADIYAATKTGHTPMELALLWKRDKIMEELEKRAAFLEHQVKVVVVANSSGQYYTINNNSK